MKICGYLECSGTGAVRCNCFSCRTLLPCRQ